MEPADNADLLAALGNHLIAAEEEGGPRRSDARRVVINALRSTEVLVVWAEQGPELGRGIYASRVLRLFSDDEAAQACAAYRPVGATPPQYRQARADKDWWSQAISDWGVTHAVINPAGPAAVTFNAKEGLRPRLLGRRPHDAGSWVDLAWRTEQRGGQEVILAEMAKAKARANKGAFEKGLLRRKAQSERFSDHLWHHAGSDLTVGGPNLFNDSALTMGSACLRFAELWGSAGQTDRCFDDLIRGGGILVDSLEHDVLNDHDRIWSCNGLAVMAAAAEDMDLADRREETEKLSEAATRFPRDPNFAPRPTPT